MLRLYNPIFPSSLENWKMQNKYESIYEDSPDEQEQELDSPAVSALGVRERKLSNALNGQSWDG
jgi:hypothetical protein